MKIALLDAKTLGKDVPYDEKFRKFGELKVYETTTPEQIIERAKECDILISNKVVINKETMEKCPNLKLICVTATGINNVDKEHADKKGIIVKNAVDYSSNSVAQVTFTMILYLLNKPSYYDNYVKSGEYSNTDIFTHLDKPFWQLDGKRLGIIGLGNIGKTTAKIAEGFGMNICFYSASGKNTHPIYKKVELDELMSSSDVIAIHAPLNEKTVNQINYDKIKLMKKTALLINSGRGGIVNEPDLVKALNENLIAGAGLDVFQNEPIEKNNPLLSLKDKEKVALFPHIAWSSVEARNLVIDKTCSNISSFLAKE